MIFIKKGEVTHEFIKYVYKVLLRHENTKNSHALIAIIM